MKLWPKQHLEGAAFGMTFESASHPFFVLSRNTPPHNRLLRMEEGRDDTKNVCGADYDMCRWLDFLCFWDTDNKPQALTSVVNYYP